MKTIISLAIFCVSFICLVSPHSAWSEIETGDSASDFSLTTFDGEEVTLSELKGKTVVLEWFNPECPFVKKHYRKGAMQELQNEYADKGVVWLAINSTHANHSNYYTSEQMNKLMSKWKIQNAKVLDDSTASVGTVYSAKTTPHMFVVDAEGRLAYQGAIDDQPSVFADPRESKNYVREALDALMQGQPVPTASTKPYGCSVKYAKK